MPRCYLYMQLVQGCGHLWVYRDVANELPLAAAQRGPRAAEPRALAELHAVAILHG